MVLSPGGGSIMSGKSDRLRNLCEDGNTNSELLNDAFYVFVLDLTPFL